MNSNITVAREFILLGSELNFFFQCRKILFGSWPAAPLKLVPFDLEQRCDFPEVNNVNLHLFKKDPMKNSEFS